MLALRLSKFDFNKNLCMDNTCVKVFFIPTIALFEMHEDSVSPEHINIFVFSIKPKHGITIWHFCRIIVTLFDNRSIPPYFGSTPWNKTRNGVMFLIRNVAFTHFLKILHEFFLIIYFRYFNTRKKCTVSILEIIYK